jgi:hypothetical protein
MKNKIFVVLILLISSNQLFASVETCFGPIQSELNKMAKPNEVITLKSVDKTENQKNKLDIYAWIEYKSDPQIWPYHTYWTAEVEQSDQQCFVKTIRYIEGHM